MTLRGSHVYLENAKKDVLAIIRQLWVPTWFLSFSAAETKWNSLLKILSKLLNNGELSDEEIFEISSTDKCELIKKKSSDLLQVFSSQVPGIYAKDIERHFKSLGKIVDFFFPCRVPAKRFTTYSHAFVDWKCSYIWRNDNKGNRDIYW